MALHTTIATSAPTNSRDSFHRQIRYRHTLASLTASLAGLTLFAASASTNALYGWAKSDFLPQQLTWAAVSVAASVILAIAPSAFLQAIRARALAGAIMASLAFCLCGSYSLTAAIGASAGYRMTAQSEQDTQSGKRQRLERSYAAANSELAKLASARPVGELSARISALKMTPGANGCTKEPDGPISRKVCKEVADLEIEHARAQRRGKLEVQAADASAELSHLGSSKVANTDATALSGYLAVAGVPLSVDALNRWLALLAVALVEFGGGIAFALAQLLRVERQDASQTPPRPSFRATSRYSLEHMEHGLAPSEPDSTDFLELAKQSEGGTADVPKLVIADDLPGRVVELVRSHGTQLMGSHRTFATALGCSHTQVARVLSDLEAAGTISLTKGKSGTVIQLKKAA
ncbi:MAG: helix-turn-helix transcriptional regulator [Hyphomicrobium sp.]